jgi:putrescine transport system substrate-binding protein
MNVRKINRCLAVALLASSCQAAVAANELNIINWSGYVSDDALASFKQDTGAAVKYDVLDSDDTLQAKLLGGNSGYDVTYPSSTYMAKQIEAGVYDKIDWAKIPNKANLDPLLMSKVAKMDPGNQYGVPYVWGTDGLIVNMTKVRKVLGADAKIDGWDLIFNPQVASKVSACGISVMDSGTDVVPIMLAYMGRDPENIMPDDVTAAYEQLNKVRPHWTQFSSSYLNDVVGGDICVAAGWSGDASVIRQRVAEAGSGDEIVYLAPKGSTGLWFTLMGIPKDAPNKDNAYKWINHLLSKPMAASTVDFIGYTSAVMSAKPLVSESLQKDPVVYPSSELIEQAFTFQPMPPKVLQQINKLWLRLKSAG